MTATAYDLWKQAERAYDAKNLGAAEALYRRALEASPGYPPAAIGLSTVLTRRGAHRESHAVIRTAVGMRLEHPALVFSLAQRLRYFHEFETLERTLQDPELLDGAPPDVLAKSVVLLSSINANDAAQRLADFALAKHPNVSALRFVRGNLHFFDGNTDAAESSYEAALAINSKFFQASWMLASVRRQTPEHNHTERLRRQLAEAAPGSESETYAAFGLHKELHDLGDYAGAWEALVRGCAAKRRHVSYDPVPVSELVAAQRAVCTPMFVRSGSLVEQAHVPIFIVGMHRSGTTLLERMLAGHPDVGDAGETRAFDAQMELAIDRSLPSGIDAMGVKSLAGADFDAVARNYARHAPWLSRGKPFFTEKLPMNFWNVGMIARAIPQARFVHLVRDPMDTCFSNLRTLFAGVATYSYDQEELAGFFRAYRSMMAHWSEVLPDRVLDVRYDSLVAEPEATVLRVLEHCGLRRIEGLSDVARSGGRVSTASAGTARQGILRDRGGVWRHYEAQLAPLRDHLAG